MSFFLKLGASIKNLKFYLRIWIFTFPWIFWNSNNSRPMLPTGVELSGSQFLKRDISSMCHCPQLSLVSYTLPASLMSGFRFCAHTYGPHCFLTKCYFPLPSPSPHLTKGETDTEDFGNSSQIRKVTTKWRTHLSQPGYMSKTAVRQCNLTLKQGLYHWFDPSSPRMHLHNPSFNRQLFEWVPLFECVLLQCLLLYCVHAFLIHWGDFVAFILISTFLI